MNQKLNLIINNVLRKLVIIIKLWHIKWKLRLNFQKKRIKKIKPIYKIFKDKNKNCNNR